MEASTIASSAAELAAAAAAPAPAADGCAILPIANSTCSSCGTTFDGRRKRRLVDACGHARCYTCVVSEEQCSSCQRVQKEPLTTGETSAKTTATKKYPGGTHGVQSDDHTAGVSILPPPPTAATAQSQLIELLMKQPQPQSQSPSPGRLPFSLDGPSGQNLPNNRSTRSSSKIVHDKRNSDSSSAHLGNQSNARADLRSNGKAAIPFTDVVSHQHELYDSTPSELMVTSNCVSRREAFDCRPSYATGGSSAISRCSLPDSNADDGVISLMSASSSAGSRVTSRKCGGVYGNGEDSDVSSIGSSASGRQRGYANDLQRLHGKRSNSMSGASGGQPDDVYLNSFEMPRKDVRRSSWEGSASLNTHSEVAACVGTAVAPEESACAVTREIPTHSSLSPELIGFVPLAQSWNFRDTSSDFVGRQWLFETLEEMLLPVETNRNSRAHGGPGVVIVGGPGTGKTAIVRQLFEQSPLAECTDRRRSTGSIPLRSTSQPCDALLLPQPPSCNSRKWEAPARTGSVADEAGSQTPISPVDAVRRLGKSVVACHLCNIDDAATCDAAEFVHNIASQMALSPRLTAYRSNLVRDKRLRDSVGLAACLRDAAAAFESGVASPLRALRARRQIDDGVIVVLVDAVQDSEYHKPDCGGYTIGSLIASVLPLCPPFLRFVITTSSAIGDNIHALGFRPLRLDLPALAGSAAKTAVDDASDSCCSDGRPRSAEIIWEGGHGRNIARDIAEYYYHRRGSQSGLHRCPEYLLTDDDHRCRSGSSAVPSVVTSPMAATCPYRRKGVNAATSRDAVSSQLDALLQHLLDHSRGSFLFCKLLLALAEADMSTFSEGCVPLHRLPTDLSDVLECVASLRFPSLRTFERLKPIISLCLASLSPLTADELFRCLNAGCVKSFVSREEFEQRLRLLDPCLRRSEDGRISFINSSWREWFLWRSDGRSSRFLCDPRSGHALIALSMTRSPDKPVVGEQVIELAHHILKAHVYKEAKVHQTTTTAVASTSAAAFTVPPRDLQAYWLVLGAADLSSGLVCTRNLYTPNLKVSRLLLLCGASPTVLVPLDDDATTSVPVLSAASRKGLTELMAVLLEFGAPVDAADAAGATALCFAAAAGQLNAVKMLCDHGASLTGSGSHSPLVQAAQQGHVEVVKFLANTAMIPGRASADSLNVGAELRSAIVAAAACGHLDCIDFLIDKMTQVGESWDDVGRLSEDTALTSACTNGEKAAVQLLLSHGADPAKANADGRTPLLCAARLGRWDIAVLLVHAAAGRKKVHNGSVGSGGVESAAGSDDAAAVHDIEAVAACDVAVEPCTGRTALMVAAAEGHGSVVEMLLTNGASVARQDSSGLTAFSWTCWRGHLTVAQSLIQWGAEIEHLDRAGRSPLDLAVSGGHADVVQYLLDQGARVEANCVGAASTGSSGCATSSSVRSPLDAAAARGDTAVVRCFLRRGAKLGAGTWAAAERWPDVLQLLLEKLLADGIALYRKHRIKEAAIRFQYALKRMPSAAVQQPAAEACTSGSARLPLGSPHGVDRAAWSAVAQATMRELQCTLLLNLSRCLRKLGDLGGAVNTATAVLATRPRSFDAYYARARAHRDARQYAEATADVDEALRFSPENHELRRLLVRLRDACKQQATASLLCGGDGNSGNGVLGPPPPLPASSSRHAAWPKEPEETSL